MNVAPELWKIAKVGDTVELPNGWTVGETIAVVNPFTYARITSITPDGAGFAFEHVSGPRSTLSIVTLKAIRRII